MAEHDAQLLLSARQVFETRRRRQQLLPNELFGEPSWDILLNLFIAHLEGERRSERDCYANAGVPAPVAMRWIAILENADLIRRDTSRHDDPEWLSLTPQGIAKMSGVMATNSA